MVSLSTFQSFTKRVISRPDLGATQDGELIRNVDKQVDLVVSRDLRLCDRIASALRSLV